MTIKKARNIFLLIVGVPLFIILPLPLPYFCPSRNIQIVSSVDMSPVSGASVTYLYRLMHSSITHGGSSEIINEKKILTDHDGRAKIPPLFGIALRSLLLTESQIRIVIDKPGFLYEDYHTRHGKWSSFGGDPYATSLPEPIILVPDRK